MQTENKKETYLEPVKQRWSYDGNDNETYYLFDENVRVAEMFISEDDIIEIVKLLNVKESLAKALQDIDKWGRLAVDDLSYLLNELSINKIGGSYRASTTLGRLKETLDNAKQVLKEAGLEVK